MPTVKKIIIYTILLLLLCYLIMLLLIKLVQPRQYKVTTQLAIPSNEEIHKTHLEGYPNSALGQISPPQIGDYAPVVKQPSQSQSLSATSTKISSVSQRLLHNAVLGKVFYLTPQLLHYRVSGLREEISFGRTLRVHDST